jgi:RNA polymerase-binding transcription factor DksA
LADNAFMATSVDILGLHRKPKVAPQWREHYRRLGEERDRLLQRDLSTPPTSSAKLDDPSDAAAEESQRSLSLVAASATKANIIEVIEAIRRIESGNYGVCEITGRPIESERLLAIPWTRCSLRGQNEIERSGYGHKNAIPALQPVLEPELEPSDDSESEQAA